MSGEFRVNRGRVMTMSLKTQTTARQVRSLSPVLNQHLPLCLVSCLFVLRRNERTELDMQVLLVDERQLKKKRVRNLGFAPENVINRIKVSNANEKKIFHTSACLFTTSGFHM